MTIAAGEKAEKFAFTASRGFESWLARANGAIAFTTYQAGKLFLLGLGSNGRLSVFERTFSRCMGLSVSDDARTLLLATEFQIYRFDNALPPGTQQGGYDAVFVPRLSWITGDLDIHDLGFGGDGDPIFVNTKFSCIATASRGWSFRPLWTPPFITRLAPEDRCHLNGLALEDRRPRYVTMVSASNVADGWRDRRSSGGLVIDVESNEVICQDLSMPHSPRLHAGKLWLLNSGTGELGTIDPVRKCFEPLAFCPGYARGLAFAGDDALVGLSLARENRTFQGLALDNRLKENGSEARCGLLVIDTISGNTVAWIRLEGVVRELYDVAFIPGVRAPSAIGFKSDEILRIVTIDESGVTMPQIAIDA